MYIGPDLADNLPCNIDNFLPDSVDLSGGGTLVVTGKGEVHVDYCHKVVYFSVSFL